MKYLKFLVVVSAILVSSVWAASLDDGFYALEQKDYATALRVLRPLADRGDAQAQTVLGSMYLKGEGVPRNNTQGVAWIRKAAEQGYPLAQMTLGAIYAEGSLGVPKDDQQAYFWWLLASARGDVNAIRNRDLIEPSITSEQRAAAQPPASE